MATKKPTTKKAPTKKAPAKKKTTKAAKVAKPTSFRLTKAQRPFLTYQVTRDTYYWLILGVLSIIFVSYLMYVQNKVTDIYDQVDANSVQSQLNADEIQRLHDALEKSHAQK